MRFYFRIYLAGRLRGNFIQKRINMFQAKRMAKKLWRLGFAVYSPHMNSGFVDNPKTDPFIIQANKDFIKDCEAVFVFNKWIKSEGTIEEIKIAHSLDIPVYYYLEDIMEQYREDDKC